MEPLCPQGGLAFWLGNLHREELTLDKLKERGWNQKIISTFTVPKQSLFLLKASSKVD